MHLPKLLPNPNLKLSPVFIDPYSSQNETFALVVTQEEELRSQVVWEEFSSFACAMLARQTHSCLPLVLAALSQLGLHAVQSL